VVVATPTSVLDAVRCSGQQVGPEFAVDAVGLDGEDPFASWMRERAEPFYRSA
jgi:hypothetical protein